MRGTVLVAGQPAEGVLVVFQPLGAKSEPGRVVPRTMAPTDANGEFRLSTFGSHDGAPPGEYAVTLAWHERPFDENIGEDRWKGKFGNPAQPVRRVTVTAGDNVLAPIEVNP